jgi:hypothetical protein
MESHGKNTARLICVAGSGFPVPGGLQNPVRYELHSPIVESEQNCSA